MNEDNNGRTLRDIYASLVDCPTTMIGHYHGRTSQASVLLLMQIKSGGVKELACKLAQKKKSHYGSTCNKICGMNHRGSGQPWDRAPL